MGIVNTFFGVQGLRDNGLWLVRDRSGWSLIRACANQMSWSGMGAAELADILALCVGIE